MTPIKITAGNILGILLLTTTFCLPELAIAGPRLPAPGASQTVPRGQIQPGSFARKPAELRLSSRGTSPGAPLTPNTRFRMKLSVRNTGGTRAYVRVVQIGRIRPGLVGVTARSPAIWVDAGQTVQTRVPLQANGINISGDRYRTTLHLFNASVPGRRGLIAQAWKDRYTANNSIKISVPISATLYTVFAKLRSITFNGNCRRTNNQRTYYRMRITAEALRQDNRPRGPLYVGSRQSANFPSSGEYTGRMRPGLSIRMNKTFRFDHVYKGHPFLLSMGMTRYDKKEWIARIYNAPLGTAVTEVRPQTWLHGFSYTSHSGDSSTSASYACRRRGIFSAHWQVWSRPER